MKDRSFNPGIEGTWVGILGLEGFQLTKYRKITLHNAWFKTSEVGGLLLVGGGRLGGILLSWGVARICLVSDGFTISLRFFCHLGATWLRFYLKTVVCPETPICFCSVWFSGHSQRPRRSDQKKRDKNSLPSSLVTWFVLFKCVASRPP